MNRHIEELTKKIAHKEQEKTVIRDQIKELQERKRTDEQAKQTALADGDDNAFLAAHRRIQDHEAQINALQDLLEAKEKLSNTRDIISALNKAIGDFENDRQKAVKKYNDAKRALAEMYASICHDETEMKKIRADWMVTGDISDLTGEVRKIESFENGHREAVDYFRDELSALGYDIAAIKMGRQGF